MKMVRKYLCLENDNHEGLDEKENCVVCDGQVIWEDYLDKMANYISQQGGSLAD